MIRLDSAITVSLKADYTAEFVKTAMMNISQNFGQEKIIKYVIRNIYIRLFPVCIHLYIL